jgi:hypothetical protein
MFRRVSTKEQALLDRYIGLKDVADKTAEAATAACRDFMLASSLQNTRNGEVTLLATVKGQPVLVQAKDSRLVIEEEG